MGKAGRSFKNPVLHTLDTSMDVRSFLGGNKEVQQGNACEINDEEVQGGDFRQGSARIMGFIGTGEKDFSLVYSIIFPGNTIGLGAFFKIDKFKHGAMVVERHRAVSLHEMDMPNAE